MANRYKILVVLLSVSLVLLLSLGGPSSSVATVEASGFQNLAFSDEEEEKAYEEFRKIATVRGKVFEDLDKIEVVSKLEHGVWDVESNLYLVGEGLRILDIHIDEIPPGEHNVNHRGPNEAVKYVLSGRGYMLLQLLGGAEQKIELKEGSLVAVPRYSWHYSFNTDPDRPLRMLAVTPGQLIHLVGTDRPADPANDEYAREAKERLMKK
ncbi:MAG: cupin domain-containing protein [Acidobacteriota bacterium]